MSEILPEQNGKQIKYEHTNTKTNVKIVDIFTLSINKTSDLVNTAERFENNLDYKNALMCYIQLLEINPHNKYYIIKIREFFKKLWENKKTLNDTISILNYKIINQPELKMYLSWLKRQKEILD